jgi:hypothetical protein
MGHMEDKVRVGWSAERPEMLLITRGEVEILLDREEAEFVIEALRHQLELHSGSLVPRGYAQVFSRVERTGRP